MEPIPAGHSEVPDAHAPEVDVTHDTVALVTHDTVVLDTQNTVVLDLGQASGSAQDALDPTPPLSPATPGAAAPPQPRAASVAGSINPVQSPAPAGGPGAPTGAPAGVPAPQSGWTAPPAGATGPVSSDPTHPVPSGWESIDAWRSSIARGAPTAWSKVPPFMPAPQQPVLVMRNNFAVVGATLGSVSLFLSLIPLVGLVSLLLAPIGLGASIVGLIIGVQRKVARVGAIWGILTSGLALLVCLGWALLITSL